jgi:hypothetical protein
MVEGLELMAQELRMTIFGLKSRVRGLVNNSWRRGWGLGVRVQGLGLGVWSFGVWGLGFGI